MTMLTFAQAAPSSCGLGEQIHRARRGNGMSLLIFAGIVVGLPRVCGSDRQGQKRRLGRIDPILMAGLVIFMSPSSLYRLGGAQRTPHSVQYAKRVVVAR